MISSFRNETFKLTVVQPGKEEMDPKYYRPISLFCYTYKIYQTMLLNQLMTIVDKELIIEQAGFRPEKSCTSQIMNLIQNIEKGLENKLQAWLSF